MAELTHPRRWVVIGTTGSGKTTFARRLGELLGLPVTELDALNWQPNWQEADREEFRREVDVATSGEAWIIEGGYSRVNDLTWGRAEALVWLDYAYPIILNRLFWRTLRRGTRREVLWNGNVEPFWPHFTSRDSLFLWQLKTHWRRRPKYHAWLAGEYSHLQLHHFRRPGEAEGWLQQLSASPTPDHTTLSDH